MKIYFIKFFLLMMFVFCVLVPSAQTSNDFNGIDTYLQEMIDYGWEICSEDSDSALRIIEQAMPIAIEYKDVTAEAELIRMAGIVSFYRVDYEKALNLFIESRELCRAHNNVRGEAKALANISLIFNQQGLYEKSLEMELEVLDMWKNIDDVSRMAGAYNNLGVAYFNLDNYVEALKFYKKAAEMGESAGSNKFLDLYYNNVGNVYLMIDSLDRAKPYFDRAMVIADDTKDKQMQCNSYAYLGEYYMLKKSYEEAIVQLEKSYSLANDIGIVYEIETAAMKLHEAYVKTGDFHKAYTMLLTYKNMADSANNLETIQKLTEIESAVKYEKELELQQAIAEKKEIQNELEYSQQHNVLVISLILLVVAVVFSSFVYQQYQRKSQMNRELTSQRDEILSQKEEIETQRDKIEALNHTKDKFFAIIAHDLRNPLSAMDRLAEILDVEYDTLEKDKIRTFIHQINLSSKKTFDLLENLLQWAIVQTGSIQINPSVFNLTTVIRDSIELLQGNLSHKNMQINFPQCVDCMVNGDVEMITTVVRNLLQNAIKFSKEGNRLDFAIDKSDDYWRVSLKDQGIGMSVEDQALLFDLNHDKKKIGNSKEKGTGIGLMLCKEFVELNGGIIWVESEYHVGTTFYFTLPAVS